MQSFELTIYDVYSNDYSFDEWNRLCAVAFNAHRDGYPVKFDEYQGQPLAWVNFADEGEAALFKLRYL